MFSSSPAWVKGCGIGCLVVLLLNVAVALSIFWIGKGAFNGLKELEQGVHRLEALHGRPQAFVPEAEGTISEERMEAFLRVRTEVQPACEDLGGGLADLERVEENGGPESFWDGLRMAKSLASRG